MTVWGGRPQEGLGKLVRTDASWKTGSAAFRVAEGGGLVHVLVGPAWRAASMRVGTAPPSIM